MTDEYDDDLDPDQEGPADPFTETDLGAGATMAHELFVTYQEVGFTPDQALYLTGCVVSMISAGMQQAELVGHVEEARRAAWQATMDLVQRQAAERRAAAAEAEWHRREAAFPRSPGPDRTTGADPTWDPRAYAWVYPSDSPPAWATDPRIWGPEPTLGEYQERIQATQAAGPEPGSAEFLERLRQSPPPEPVVTWWEMPCPKCHQRYYWAVNRAAAVPGDEATEMERLRTDLLMECPDHGDRPTAPPQSTERFTIPGPKCAVCHGPLVTVGDRLVCPIHEVPPPVMGGGR